MQDKLTFQELLLKHFNEPQDQILAERIASLRTSSEENERIFQEYTKVWELSAETRRLQGLDRARSVSNFRLKLGESQPLVQKRRSYWGSVAAAAVLALTLGTWIYTEKNQVNELVKQSGETVDSVLLSDGTKVILAAHTKISYPEKFLKKERAVKLLNGKAFFLVGQDASRPFEVAVGASKVKVLGTSFNLKYSETKIELAVNTGRVMFTPNSKSKPSVLNAGEGISYQYLANMLKLENDGNAAAWFTKELRFVDMPLDEVCKQLSEYYGVRIILHDRKLTAKKFNANFNHTSLDDALTALKETYAIKITRDGQQIIIKSL